MHTKQIDFAEEIRQATDLETSWRCLMDQLNRLGFIHAKYGFVIAAPQRFRREDLVMTGHFCNEWESAQEDHENWIEHDFIADHLLQVETPVTFSYVYHVMDSGRMTRKQAVNHAIGREIGMAHGVALPIRERSPVALGGISLEADRGFSSTGFRKHLDHVLPELKDLVDIFHSNINRPQMLDDARHPSKREQECLKWVMKGLRVQQIAYEIGTHPKTIEKQLANVRHKLGARTNAQAATRALLMDLIAP